MMKQERHAAIRARAERAIQNMYHNATPLYPRDVPEEHWRTFEDWLGYVASCEIQYIQDGGAYAATESRFRAILEANAAVAFNSEAARRYYVRKGMRQYRLDRQGWEHISEFGKLYTWGRGGRTLAPDHLVSQRGGSSFRMREDYPAECTIAECVDLICIVESFNAYVAEWCKNVPDMWREHFAENYGGADVEATAELSTTD